MLHLLCDGSTWGEWETHVWNSSTGPGNRETPLHPESQLSWQMKQSRPATNFMVNYLPWYGLLLRFFCTVIFVSGYDSFHSFTIWMMLTILDTEHHGILRTLSNRHTKQFFSQSFMRNHNLLRFRICSFLAVMAKFSLSIKEYNSIEVSGGISVLYIP